MTATARPTLAPDLPGTPRAGSGRCPKRPPSPIWAGPGQGPGRSVGTPPGRVGQRFTAELPKKEHPYIGVPLWAAKTRTAEPRRTTIERNHS